MELGKKEKLKMNVGVVQTLIIGILVNRIR